jgi:hypothetical protein
MVDKLQETSEGNGQAPLEGELNQSPKPSSPKRVSRMAKKLENDLQDFLETIFQLEGHRSQIQYLDPSFIEAHRLKMFTVNEESFDMDEDFPHSSIDFESHNNGGQYSIEKSSTLLSGVADSDHERNTTKSNLIQKNLGLSEQEHQEDKELGKSIGSLNQSSKKQKSSASISKIQETIKMMHQKPRTFEGKLLAANQVHKRTTQMDKHSCKDSGVGERKIMKPNSAADSQSLDSQEQLQASQVLLNSLSDNSQQTKQKYERPMNTTRPGLLGFEGYSSEGFAHRSDPRSQIGPGIPAQQKDRDRTSHGSSKTLWADGIPPEMQAAHEFYPARMISPAGYPMQYGYFDSHYLQSHPQHNFQYAAAADLARFNSDWNAEMYHRYGPMYYPAGYGHPLPPQMPWYSSQLSANLPDSNFAEPNRFAYSPNWIQTPQPELKKSAPKTLASQKVIPSKIERKLVTLSKQAIPDLRFSKPATAVRTVTAPKAKSPSIERRFCETERQSSSSVKTKSNRQSSSKLPGAETPTRLTTGKDILSKNKLLRPSEIKPKQTAALIANSMLGSQKTVEAPKRTGLTSLYSRLDSMLKRPTSELTGGQSSVQNSANLQQKIQSTKSPNMSSITKKNDNSPNKLNHKVPTSSVDKSITSVLGKTPKYQTQRPSFNIGNRLGSNLAVAGDNYSQSSSRSGTPQKLVGRMK